MGLYTYLWLPNPFRSFANGHESGLVWPFTFELQPHYRKEQDDRDRNSNKEGAHLRW